MGRPERRVVFEARVARWVWRSRRVDVRAACLDWRARRRRLVGAGSLGLTSGRAGELDVGSVAGSDDGGAVVG